MMIGMPDTVVFAWLFVVGGVLIAGLCITRMVSVHGKDFGRRRKISEWAVAVPRRIHRRCGRGEQRDECRDPALRSCDNSGQNESHPRLSDAHGLHGVWIANPHLECAGLGQ